MSSRARRRKTHYETRELHFTTHLAIESRPMSSGGSGGSQKPPAADGIGEESRRQRKRRGRGWQPEEQPAWKKGAGKQGAGGKGAKGKGGKGKGAKGGGDGKGGGKARLLREVPDGRPICFKHNVAQQ